MLSTDPYSFAGDDLDSLLWYPNWLYGNPGEEALQCGRLRSVLPLTETDHSNLHTRRMIQNAAGRRTAQHRAHQALTDEDFLKGPSPYDSTVPHCVALPSVFIPNTGRLVPPLSDYSWRSHQLEIQRMSEAENPFGTPIGVWPPNLTYGDNALGSTYNPSLTPSFEHVGPVYDDDLFIPSSPTESGSSPRSRGCVKEGEGRKPRQKTKKKPPVSKGVTMYLRTLLRQLLAGTGWIMDSSISKAKATKLIKRLLGQKLTERIQVELPAYDTGTLPHDLRDNHYQRILAEIMTCVLQRPVTQSETQRFITRDKGPYRLTSVFVNFLSHKQWPPYLPSDSELRSYGCYREGEGSVKVKPDYI